MRTLILIIVLLPVWALSQSPCDNIKYYDDIIVKDDQPAFQKMKKFAVERLPDSTLNKMKNELKKITSPAFVNALKIKSVHLYDSAVARARSWTHEPIRDKELKEVHFLYSVLFETKIGKGLPFIFRVDFLKNGTVFDSNRLGFFKSSKSNIIGCKKVSEIVLSDSIHPVKSIDYISLVYSPPHQAIIWTVEAAADLTNGIKYFKEIDAISGKIIGRFFHEIRQPVKLEEVRVQ